MDEKFSFKLVQNGQTKLSRQIRTGAGANGQALVVKAEEASSYQLVNVVTLTSPAKMQLKRKGDDLQLSLPGGDADTPDVIIQGYFAVEGNVLKGVSQNGEWMTYDTSVFLPKPPNATDKPVKALNPDAPVAIGLADPPMGLMSKFDSPLGLAAIGGGVVAVGSMGHGSGGGSANPSSTPVDNFTVFKSYAGASAASAVAPTAAQYTTAGVAVPTVDSVTAANVLAAMNQLVSSKAASEVDSKEKLQKIADALKSSWALIIAEANGSTADATPSSSPTATDYLNVGVVVGKTTKALDLMNSALTELTTTNLDTSAEIKDLATAADNLMKLAAGTSGASVSSSDLLSLGLKINGVNSGITALEADAFTKNLANLQTSLGKTDSLSTGAAVDTIAEVQALFSLQAMRSYNDDTATTKTQVAPGVIDYTNIGIKSYASATDTTEANRIALDASNFGVSNLQTTLNSALDNQVSGTALTKTVVQTMVDAYFKVLKEAGSTTSNAGFYENVDSTSNPNPSLANYTSLGITHVDKTALAATDTSLLSLLNDAIGRLSASAVDTAGEIQAIEKAAENILAQGTFSPSDTHTYGVTYTTDSEWVTGFSALGVTGVTSSNLAGIKTAIDTKITGTDLSAIYTVQDLQAIVSLYRINDYAENSTSDRLPTLADYQAVLLGQNSKLTDPLSANLSAYNNMVLNKPDGASQKTFTDTQIKSMVLSYNTILNFADGDSNIYPSNVTVPTKSDFENIGVGNGLSPSLKPSVTNMLTTDEYASLLADVIGGKSSYQVNTVSQLNSLATIIERISKLEAKTSSSTDSYTTITGGPLSVTDFDLLGLDTKDLKVFTGTTLQSKVKYINDQIALVDDANSGYTKENFDSIIELNKLIQEAVLKNS